MTAHLRKWLGTLSDTFWLVPGALTLLGVFGAAGMVHLDQAGAVPGWIAQNGWIYDGGGTGARTLLGAIASSTIGVAGTVFSITIAALSLAAGQMGPRLLRNFTRDRGVQVTLGTFIGTFCYALMVLRSVRTDAEGAFTPHLSLTVGIALAFVCVATLVYFVGHMAGRINVDTVIDLVGREARKAIQRLTRPEPGHALPDASVWEDAAVVDDDRSGYLQHIDTEGLAQWAAEHGATIRLLVRPGDPVFPGVPVALVVPQQPGAQAAVQRFSALGPERVSSADLEFAMRLLVEVAVRAMSPGINDPHTAISVLDRLGGLLCDVARVHLPTGVHRVADVPRLVVPSVDYDGLTDAMFHMIRQYGSSCAPVLIRMLEVLRIVASTERDPLRLQALARHADLIVLDARRCVLNPRDLADVQGRYRAFARMVVSGPCAQALA